MDASSSNLLAKLTALSTQTLSLLLERQRLSTFTLNATNAKPNTLHLPQITRNLRQLREGVLQLEERDGRSEAVELLRAQYGRMCGMVDKDVDVEKEGLLPLVDETPVEQEAVASSSSRSSSPMGIPRKARETLGISGGNFAPYSDDPERGPEEEQGTDMLLQEQSQLMAHQDDHLDALSRSIGRQRDLSLQINDELDTHHGLLESLDHELDRTSDRLSTARRKLNKFAKGVKGNGSTYTIAGIILILLILIIIFKT
ncbi:hypothetical protein PUNSTDRAFT_91765 [Punctularia strigosozonata HHB-11173 SS5]|uniref:uncharacterized protein n=1 Tax=Punctularia strigosozonata (strain HHB-11173) TaxID=741275 RepID=UPI0004417DDE|nr:uncharacterized protein PUNSTDRAFT_91765 [Punctularia strigosozonata HHB-11173 SS5]EIN05491.1 hypothetical protein PUNSTDRAFT_91765 [Punctularia strigosozonata HHB-11173 SS5]